jgi:hypothetical protein
MAEPTNRVGWRRGADDVEIPRFAARWRRA